MRLAGNRIKQPVPDHPACRRQIFLHHFRGGNFRFRKEDAGGRALLVLIHVAEDIFFGDPTMFPRSLDFIDIHTVFPGQTPRGGGCQNSFFLVLLRGHRGRSGFVFLHFIQNFPNGNHLPFGPFQIHDFSAGRRRQFHHRFVGLHFQNRLIFFNSLSFFHQPADNFGFRHPFADIRQTKFHCHFFSPLNKKRLGKSIGTPVSHPGGNHLPRHTSAPARHNQSPGSPGLPDTKKLVH